MNIKTLLKGTAVLTFSSVTTLLGSMFLLPLFARLLTPDMFGVLGLLDPFTQLIMIVFCLGLTTAVAREIVDMDEPSGELGSYLFTVNLVLVIVGAVGFVLLVFSPTRTLLIAGLNIGNIQIEYVILAYVMGILSIFGVMLNVYYNFKQIFVRRALVTLVAFVLNSVLSLTIIFLYKNGILGELLGGIAAQLLLLVILGREYFGKFKFRLQRKYVMSSLKIGIPITILGLFSLLSNTGNRFIMNLFVPLAVIGQYSLAWTVVSPVNIVFASFHVTWMPMFFDHLNRKRPYRELEDYMIAVLVLITACIFLAQIYVKDLALILLGKKYYDASEIAIGVVPYFLGLSVASFLGDYLIYFKKPAWSTTTFVVVGILSLFCNYILIPILGINASILLLTVSQIAINTALFVILYLVFKVSFRYWIYALLYLIVFNPLTLIIGKLQIQSSQELLIKLSYSLFIMVVLVAALPQKQMWFNRLIRVISRVWWKQSPDGIDI